LEVIVKKKLLLWFGVAPVVILGCLLAIPSDRYFLMGLLRDEGSHDGRPASYWMAELKDEDAGRRKDAAAALGAIGPTAREAAPALAAALKDDDDLVRMNAALALFKIGAADEETVAALAAALEDPHLAVRADATLALRRAGPAAAAVAPALIKALQDPANRVPVAIFYTTSVAQVAAQILGDIGPPARDAIPVLAEIYADKRNDEALRKEAARALKKIDPPDARS
jgi:HEAT repeat protein